MRVVNVLRDLWSVKSTVVVISTPLLLLPLLLIPGTQEAKCAYALLLMAIYWITEAIPLPVTALLPVFLFPILGIQRVTEVCSNYTKDAIMFGIGGLIIAIAVEKCNLHRRIALRVLLTVGSQVKWLMLGFMLPTWFLSMWVSNTATTAMMIPIVNAVMEQLREKDEGSNTDTVEMRKSPPYISTINSGNGVEMESRDERDTAGEIVQTGDRSNSSPTHSDEEERPEGTPAIHARMCKAMSLCVAYAANVGGTASLSGTAPNIVMQGQADRLFQKYGLDSGVDFTSWMVLALPCSVICLLVTWIWLQIYFFGWRQLAKCDERSQQKRDVKKVLYEDYNKLGKLSFAENAVMVHFIILILLWLTRKPNFFSGWDSLFRKGYTGDSIAAILIAVSLFIFPSRRPRVLFFRKRGAREPRTSVSPLVDWAIVHEKFPWGVLLLIGGGFALADACEKSGLSMLIGDQLTVFSGLDPRLTNLLLSLMVAGATEVTSNVATASLLLPILAQLAIQLRLNPLYLMFPCAIATSFAFMLPVATPPNALVFAYGYLRVKDMVMSGFMMNIVCVLVLQLAVNTWGNAYFNLDTIPAEFLQNITSPS